MLVDVDPDTLCIDPAQRRARAITPRTKAIMPVHYRRAARPTWRPPAPSRATHGLQMVEDAAHALPTLYEGQLVGTLGSDITVFSFYANKTITTGEGGMITTDIDECAERITVMRLHGISRDAWNRYTADGPLVLRDRRARLQVQPDRHRRRARPAPAPARRGASRAARRDRRRATTPASPDLPGS